METRTDLLEKYKKTPFAKGLLPFRSTINALGTSFALVIAKLDGRQRWVICEKSTGEPALFSHAATFAQGDDPETGNYVPADEEIPAGVEIKSIQRRANSKCFYTYVFDTFADLSLYEGQWTLDEYMGTLKGFNPTGLPRRSYLSGQDPKYRSRFWMQTPMFLRKGQNAGKEGDVGHLHPWVVQGDRQSKVFGANPDRPRIWMRDGEETVPIGDREFGPLQRGDVVAVSFTVTYHITGSNWFPQFHPADIVVLWSSEGDPTDYSAPTIGLHGRPAPVFEVVDVPAGGPEDDASGDRREDSEGSLAKKPRLAVDVEVKGAAGDGDEGFVGTGDEGSGGARDEETVGVRAEGEVGLVAVGSLEVGRRSCDTLDSFGEGGESAGESQVEKVKGVAEETVYDGFVDVAAEVVGMPAARATGGRAGRAARRRG